MILDFDATPISIHSEKELAAGHYKGGFGFNPLLASCEPGGAGRGPAARERRREQRAGSPGCAGARAGAAARERAGR